MLFVEYTMSFRMYAAAPEHKPPPPPTPRPADKDPIIIFTDVGEEIDDEIALFWLFHFSKCYTKRIIVFTQGAANATITPSDRAAIFREYFKNQMTGNVPDGIYISDLSYLSHVKGQKFSKMLQIAPLRGVPPEFFRDNEFETLYLMGQRSEPSINTCKSFPDRDDASEALWADYEAQLSHLSQVPTVEIGTALSRRVPFTAKIIEQLDEDFREPILKKAYEQFVGRVPTHLPFCYNVTFGANYPTLMAYVSGSLKASFESFKRDMVIIDIVAPLAQDFYRSIANKPVTANEDKDIQKLMDMILVVEFMTGGSYRNATLQKGEENFLNFEAGFHQFSGLVMEHNGSLTPAYDLLAMFAMVNNIPQEQLQIENAPILTQQLEEAFN